jgi:hypothetical protein
VRDNLPDTWAAGMTEWACPGCPTTAYSPSTLVPIAPLDATQRDVLKNGLTADVMGGYTPTECAYSYALDQLKSWQAPAELEGVPRFLVLLTDGVPTVTSDCQTLGAIKAGAIPLSEAQYAELIATVAEGTMETNIKTSIVGVPMSDEPQGANYDPMYMLSLLAAAGGMALPNCTPEPGTMLCPDGTVPALNALGTAFCDGHGGIPQLVTRGTYCHYDLTLGEFAANLRGLDTSLRTALRRLWTDGGIACEYPIPEPPPPYVLVDPTHVAVIFTPGGKPPVLMTPARANDCANGGQWYYSVQDPITLLPTQIDLCPDACAMARAELDVSIQIQFACLGTV